MAPSPPNPPEPPPPPPVPVAGIVARIWLEISAGIRHLKAPPPPGGFGPLLPAIRGRSPAPGGLCGERPAGFLGDRGVRGVGKRMGARTAESSSYGARFRFPSPVAPPNLPFGRKVPRRVRGSMFLRTLVTIDP